jgi:hypothetical protein
MSLILHLKAQDGATSDITLPDPVRSPPPSTVLDLSTWKINLPDGSEVKGTAAMQALSNQWFQVVNGAVQFTVPCGGVGTPTYPRSELREMLPDGLTAQAWSTSTGVHTMTIRQRVTHLPVAKPETVCGQIHNADSANSGPEFLIVAYGPPLKDPTRIQLRAYYYWENVQVTLDPDYKLGTWYDLKVVASNGFVDVYYNGVLKGHRALAITGCYFKAGCYGQSTTALGDLPTAYSQVEMSQLAIQHA